MKKFLSIILVVLTVFSMSSLVAPTTFAAENATEEFFWTYVCYAGETKAEFDFNNMFVYNVAPGTTDIEDVISFKNAATYLIEYIGTGYRINFYVDGKICGTYQFLIYGDVTGDTWCSQKDVDVIYDLLKGNCTAEDLGKAKYTALDVNRDGSVTQVDAGIMEQAARIYEDIDTENPENTQQAYDEYNKLIYQGKVQTAENQKSLLERFIDFLNKILAFFGLHIEL